MLYPCGVIEQLHGSLGHAKSGFEFSKAVGAIIGIINWFYRSVLSGMFLRLLFENNVTAIQAGGPELAQPEKKSGKFTLKSSGQGQYKVAPGEQIKVLPNPPTPLLPPRLPHFCLTKVAFPG